MMKTFGLGMRCQVWRVVHSNVPMTTMNDDADEGGGGHGLDVGREEEDEDSSETAATMPESRPRPPDFTLMRDWPIMGVAAHTPKNPQ
ncbi:MAG: hypothetical protein R3B67_00380 [Phycisphaerales bacterium]